MSDTQPSSEIALAIQSMEPGVIPNVLADRYASTPMRQIWGPEGKVVAERFLWIAVMQAQAEAGLNIPPEDIADYVAHVRDIDFESMREREKRTEHDVKARIEEFDALAGHQHVHKGLTSRDLTDNVEQLQVMLGLKFMQGKMVAAICQLGNLAAAYSTVPIAGRSHNIPAQITTYGKRFANTGEELMDAYWMLVEHIDTYKLRGLKGPVGTRQDLLDLVEGDRDKAEAIEQHVARALGFSSLYNSVGQIYPRSRDAESAHRLTQAVAPLSNFAKGVRLMAGAELVSETSKDRDGSTAMPHKINPRTSERINGLYTVLTGYEGMLAAIAGDQWLEGSVADSVVRRVALEGSFFAADGAYEAGLTVFNEMDIYEGMAAAEIERNLPFLSTTKLLMAAVKAGMGREDAHALIKKHSFEAIRAVRKHGAKDYDLYGRLAADTAFPLDHDQITATTENPLNLIGEAEEQVAKFVTEAEFFRTEHPLAAAYQPAKIL